MRLWYKDLIPVLPRQQLLSQWRECCCIARNIAVNGTPNHILVNKIMEYSYYDYLSYCTLVISEMKRRGYKLSDYSMANWIANMQRSQNKFPAPAKKAPKQIYDGWHGDRYLRQCLYNLEEKAMADGIPADEWKQVYNKFNRQYDLWSGR